MERQSFKYIKAIAEMRSISAAAESLGISQPALSSHLKKLEGEVGAVLFDRSRQPLELTEAGKAYLRVPGANNAKEMIVIGGDVTGIESIENGTIVNDNYYTIDGKLVKGQPTQKGIYVVNGRKVVIK